jgi:hypothetical protein
MLAYRRQHQTIPVTYAFKGAAFAKAPYRLLHRCFVTGGRRTSALMRSVKFGAYRLRRGYWTAPRSSDTETRGPQFSPPGTPLIRTPPTFLVSTSPLIPPSTERLINAWKNTPTTWYPIPVAVGALLLVVLQYRRKMSRASKEVNVDEEGREVIKLRGPWQVHLVLCDTRFTYLNRSFFRRSMYLVLFRCATCLVYGATSTRSNYLSGLVPSVSDFIHTSLIAI